MKGFHEKVKDSRPLGRRGGKQVRVCLFSKAGKLSQVSLKSPCQEEYFQDSFSAHPTVSLHTLEACLLGRGKHTPRAMWNTKSAVHPTSWLCIYKGIFWTPQRTCCLASWLRTITSLGKKVKLTSWKGRRFSPGFLRSYPCPPGPYLLYSS